MNTAVPRGVGRRTVALCALGGAAALGSACVPGGAGGAESFDRQFIDMMVPHHEGAIEMAEIARRRAQRPEVRQLAEAILRSQAAEIAQMRQWRRAWYGSDQTPPMSRMPVVPGMSGGGHGGHPAGSTMDMAADVERLRRAGEPFDLAFIDEMIPHHESAVDAARAAETRAQRPEIRELARAIADEQQREIEQLREWRRAWFP